ncbi:InlB B-repeat-containing protein [Pseudoalteromonas peptidolytica]|nr:InlB B-repeat-containing protein [Pseudoalteromonas peptidolytica]
MLTSKLDNNSKGITMSSNRLYSIKLLSVLCGMTIITTHAQAQLQTDNVIGSAVECNSKIDLLTDNLKTTIGHHSIPAKAQLELIATDCQQAQPTTTADRTPPELKSIYLSSKTVNVEQGDKTINVTIRLYDESGIKSTRVYLSPPTGFNWGTNKSAVAANWQQTDEVGVYESTVSFNFTETDLNGTWFLTLAMLIDNNNAARFWVRDSEMEAAGFDPYVTVVNSKVSETVAPEIKNITISASEIDVDSGDKNIDITIEAYDQSGMSKGVVKLSPPTQYKSVATKQAESTQWQETQEEGIYKSTYSFVFSGDALPGEWLISSATLTDSSGNTGVFNHGQLHQLGVPVTFKVSNSNQLDIFPPRTEFVALSTNELSSAVGEQSITLQVTMSDTSAMEKGYYVLRSPEGSTAQDKLFTIEQWQQGDKEHEQIGTATIQFSGEELKSAQGVWTFESSIQIDSKGNYSFGATARELTTLGATPYLFVDVDNVSNLAILNLPDPHSIKLGASQTINFEVSEQTLSLLPDYFTIEIDAASELGVDVKSEDQNYSVTCSNEGQTKSCLFSGISGVKSTSAALTITPNKIGTFPVSLRLASQNHELKYSDNQRTLAVLVDEPTLFEVIFKNWDGTLLSTQTIAENAPATAPEVPLREGYTFSNWSADFSKITQNLTITAKFQINKYQVKFVDWNDVSIATVEVEHGAAATPPSAPTRSGYTFIGWDTTFERVTGEMVVKAKYQADQGTEGAVQNDAGSSGGSVGFFIPLLSALLISFRRKYRA